jgi:hypothetical protein
LQRPQVREDWSRIHNEWTILKDGLDAPRLVAVARKA